jgi:endonuclease YncB( thermonuclease family)
MQGENQDDLILRLLRCNLDNTRELSLKGRTVCARVVDVYDGDTITAITELHPSVPSVIHVRIAGIDACEMRSSDPGEKNSAIQAKLMLLDLLVGGVTWPSPCPRSYLRNYLRDHPCFVTLVGHSNDKYGRSLCDVTSSRGQNIAHAMMSSGHARAYSGGHRKQGLSSGQGGAPNGP